MAVMRMMRKEDRKQGKMGWLEGIRYPWLSSSDRGLGPGDKKNWVLWIQIGMLEDKSMLGRWWVRQCSPKHFELVCVKSVYDTSGIKLCHANGACSVSAYYYLYFLWTPLTTRSVIQPLCSFRAWSELPWDSILRCNYPPLGWEHL